MYVHLLSVTMFRKEHAMSLHLVNLGFETQSGPYHTENCPVASLHYTRNTDVDLNTIKPGLWHTSPNQLSRSFY